MRHDFGSAHDGRQRKAPADDLAERGDIRGHAVKFLRAAIGEAEPGHDLVEDQHDAVTVGLGTQKLQEARFRRDDPLQGFHDDRGDLVPMFGQQRPDIVGIVEGGDQHLGGNACGNASAVGHGLREIHPAQGGQRHLCLGAHPVIAALEFHDLVAPGEGAGEAHGIHVSLAARGDIAQLLRTGHGAADLFGQFDAGGVVGEEGHAFGKLLIDRLQHFGVAMAQ